MHGPKGRSRGGIVVVVQEEETTRDNTFLVHTSYHYGRLLLLHLHELECCYVLYTFYIVVLITSSQSTALRRDK